MSSSSSSQCRTPGKPIRDYFDRRGGKRYCQHCDSEFAVSSSGDSLKFHMHGRHKQFAGEMGIDLPSFCKVKTSPSQQPLSVSTSSSHVPIEIDDDGVLPPSPLIPQSASSSSSSRSSSSNSSADTDIVSHSSTVSVRQVVLMPPPEPRQPTKRMRQQSIRQWESTDAARSAESNDAQVDCFIHEGLPFRLADSASLHKWLQLHHSGDGTILGRRQLVIACMHGLTE
jgi:hypothetical protein